MLFTILKCHVQEYVDCGEFHVVGKVNRTFEEGYGARTVRGLPRLLS